MFSRLFGDLSSGDIFETISAYRTRRPDPCKGRAGLRLGWSATEWETGPELLHFSSFFSYFLCFFLICSSFSSSSSHYYFPFCLSFLYFVHLDSVHSHTRYCSSLKV